MYDCHTVRQDLLRQVLVDWDDYIFPFGWFGTDAKIGRNREGKNGDSHLDDCMVTVD